MPVLPCPAVPLTAFWQAHSIAIRGDAASFPEQVCRMKRAFGMKRLSQTLPNPKITEKRRGVRMNSRVPIAVEWQDAAGGTLREQAFTRVISPYGCLVVLPKTLSLEQTLRLVNLATEQANVGVVVWKGNQEMDGWEVGIELTQPPMDFWGLEL
jgi:hypothetical protein